MSQPTTSLYLNSGVPAPEPGKRNVQFQSDGVSPQQSITAEIPNVSGAVMKTTDYLLADSDCGLLVVLNSASPHIFTLPAAISFGGWFVRVQNIGAGTLTIARNGHTIDGAASDVTLTTGQGLFIDNDGMNWFTVRGGGGGGGAGPATLVAVAHKWVNAYDAPTLAFAVTQPSTADLSDFPAQTGMTGKFLTTDGTSTLSFAAVVAGPSTKAPVAHKWIDSYDATTSLFTQTQPDTADLSGTQPYELSAYVPGLYANGVLIYRKRFSYAVTFPANWGVGLTDAPAAGVDGNPTSTATITVKKNSVTVGTFSISTGGVVTFATTGGATVAFANGDVMQVYNQAVADGTLAGLDFVMVGTRPVNG